MGARGAVLLAGVDHLVRRDVPAGRAALWLAWIACGIRAVFVLLNFLGQRSLNFSEIPSLRHVHFLGESVTVLGGVPNPVQLLGHLAVRASQLVHELQAAEAGLREHQATLEASNRQISDLFGRLIAAQETERTRIARDLHDDVSQRIAGLAIMISGVKRRVRGGPDEDDIVRALTSMQQSTSELAEEIRHFSHDLHPILLQHAGLGPALRVFCAEFEKLHTVAVTCTADVDKARIDADTALCLYRIAQEGLRNVAKHADAHHVGVTLTSTTDGVQLSIADDGRGFDLTGARGTGAGLGLVSIDERARLLGGSVQIETQPEKGTRLDVQIPSPHNIAADAWHTVGSTS